ncbi:MAG: hypothetical protein BWY31_01084 [Lentisphaerae bacterium ADurb.Bin242]|nr:MAG: hypothetical protein BWY31_01084 [Lentisphaerae bacterium ADurb.Bin242]
MKNFMISVSVVLLVVLAGGFTMNGNDSNPGNPAAKAVKKKVPKSLRDRIYVWGYMIDEVPCRIPYDKQPGGTSCSLETAANYLGVRKVIYMNSEWTPKRLDAYTNASPSVAKNLFSDKHFERLSGFEEIICGLQHGDADNDPKSYAKSARRISEASLRFKNIKGAIFNDFRTNAPHTFLSPEQLKEVYDNLKSCNPGLKLWLVSYDYQPPENLVPYVKYFDVLTRWCWMPNPKYWLEDDLSIKISHLRHFLGKPIVHGLYVYPSDPLADRYMPFELFKQSFEAVAMRKTLGIIIPSSGAFHDPKRRELIQWMKNYLDWEDATTARLE